MSTDLPPTDEDDLAARARQDAAGEVGTGAGRRIRDGGSTIVDEEGFVEPDPDEPDPDRASD